MKGSGEHTEPRNLDFRWTARRFQRQQRSPTRCRDDDRTLPVRAQYQGGDRIPRPLASDLDGPAPELIQPQAALRVRARIGCAKMGVEPPGRQGARRENTRSYLTDEQRSRAGWIGAQTAQVILARALSVGDEQIAIREVSFDKVQHDILMSRVARKVADPRVLALIGRHLRAGVMVGGILQPTEQGPRKGVLSRRCSATSCSTTSTIAQECAIARANGTPPQGAAQGGAE